MIVYCLISAFINAVTSLVLGVAVWLRRPAGNSNLPFVFFAFAVGVWSVFYVLWQLAGNAAQAMTLVQLLSAVAILVPPTYYHFADRLVGSGRRVWVVGGYVAGFVFAALSFTPWICARVAPLGGFPFWPRAGALYPGYLAFFSAYTILSWANLYVAMRGAVHARRNQLKFVFAGTTLGFVGGATNFPMWYELPIPPVGNGLVAFYVVGVAYAIIRFRLLEVNYVVTKLTAYVIAALPLAFIYPGVFVVLYDVTGDPFVASVSWFLASIPLSFGAFLTLPVLKRRLDALLEKTLLKPFVTGRDRLRDLAHEVAGLRDETDIYRRSAEVVASALDAGAAFYIRGELDADYRLRAAHGVDPSFILPEEVSDDDPIIAFVRGRQRAVLIDEVATLDPEVWPAVAAEKAKRRIEVAVPVHADGYFFGLLGLGARRRHRVYSDNELSLLDTLTLQIGLHVRARQIERRANQAEKLISLGTLAAGLAHEIRNPLVSIKTFASLLGESGGDPEFQREFSSTVLRDVGRIESIIENVAAFATDRKVAHTWIRLEEVVNAAYEIARPSFVSAGVRFEFDPGEAPHVHGNHNQLTQVVLNLLNNAVQAFKDREDGCVTVRIRHRATDALKPVIDLSVSDNGPGIDPEVLSRLFEPFTTTKDTGDRAHKAGMGLGLAIVKRIVEGHHGVIRVDTEPGRGTTFTVVLPCETSAG